MQIATTPMQRTGSGGGNYSREDIERMKMSDPDGRYEYETELLGKKIKVKISDDIRKNDPDAFNRIKKNIDDSIAKINAGKERLTSNQIKAINSMKGLEVRNDVSFSFMNTNNKVFNITQRFAEGGDPDWLFRKFHPSRS